MRGLVTTIACILLVTGCTRGMNTLCSAYDVNGGAVYEDELAIGLFDAWDTDDDGVLTQEEFNEGVASSETFAGWRSYFEAWDTDDDGQLGEHEFTAGFMEAGVFGRWDADDDGSLDEDECAAAGP